LQLNNAAALYCAFSVVLLSGILCTLRSIPGHVMVGVGSSASFRCQSATANSITWRFKPLNGSWLLLNDIAMLRNGTYVLVSHDADQKISTVIISGVWKQDTGRIECADDTETCFADLTVLGE